MNADQLNKINISIAGFFIFAIVGAVIRDFLFSIKIFPFSELFYQLAIFAIPFGFFGAALAYFFPKTVGYIISLIIGLVSG